MRRVGVRELRQNASAWLARVREGEAFEITDRGVPVAVLGPLADESSGVVDRLEREGMITQRGSGAFAVPLGLPAARSTQELLDELREDTA